MKVCSKVAASLHDGCREVRTDRTLEEYCDEISVERLLLNIDVPKIFCLHILITFFIINFSTIM